MAWELLHEVDAHGPSHPDVTPAERSILRCIANGVRHYPKREVNLSHEEIAHYVGFAKDSTGPTLRDMEKKGIRVRVAIGRDRNGNNVYAVPGRVSRFRLPDYSKPDSCERCRVNKGGPRSALTEHKGEPQSALGGTTVRPRGDHSSPKGEPQSGPLHLHEEPSPSDDGADRDEEMNRAAELFQRKTGVRCHNTLEWLRRQKHLSDPERYIRACLEKDDGDNLRRKIERENAAVKPTPTPPPFNAESEVAPPASDDARRQAIQHFAQSTAAKHDVSS